jgi:hypothetical protein
LVKQNGALAQKLPATFRPLKCPNIDTTSKRMGSIKVRSVQGKRFLLGFAGPESFGGLGLIWLLPTSLNRDCDLPASF